MMYRVIIDKKATKEMLKLPKHIRQRVDIAIFGLHENPFAGKKLEGDHEGMWSLRVWPYRIIYTIERKIVTVTVLRIAHRQGVYN